jgi:EF-hand domain pair
MRNALIVACFLILCGVAPASAVCYWETSCKVECMGSCSCTSQKVAVANCNFFMCNCDPCYGTLCVALPPKVQQAGLRVYFEDVDADHNGKLDLDETVQYAKTHGKQILTRQQVRTIFNRLDTDHDGVLTQKECGLPSRPKQTTTPAKARPKS